VETVAVAEVVVVAATTTTTTMPVAAGEPVATEVETAALFVMAGVALPKSPAIGEAPPTTAISSVAPVVTL